MFGLSYQLFSFESVLALAAWGAVLASLCVLAFPPSYKSDPSVDVRNEMRQRLPNILQRLLTLQTGKPYVGQRPLWKKGWCYHLLTAFLQLFGGSCLSALVVATAFVRPFECLVLLLPITIMVLLVGWMLTIGGARKALVTVMHQIVHGRFTGDPKLDRCIGETITSLLLLQPMDAYKRDHVDVHHRFRTFGTTLDPDAKFLLQLGFGRGLSRREARHRLGRLCLSLRKYHLIFLRARLEANLLDAGTPRFRRFMAAAILAAQLLVVVSGCFVYGSLVGLIWLVAWGFPLTLGYQISALLQFSSEHTWQLQEPARRSTAYRGRKKAVIAKLTNGRFMADPMPPVCLAGMEWLHGWVWWWLRLFVFHVPMRISVIVSDLPAHDHHHRHEADPDWGDGIYSRQRDVESNCSGWPLAYTDVWGLGAAIDAVSGCLGCLNDREDDGRNGGRFDEDLLAM